MAMTTTGNTFHNVVSSMARRVFAGYLACKIPCPCSLPATSLWYMSTHKVPSKFQLSWPHLSTSDGAWGCVRPYTKTPDSSMWLSLACEGGRESLRGSEEQHRGTRWGAESCLDGVCPYEDTQELDGYCTGADPTKKKKTPKKWRLDDTKHPCISRGKVIWFTHLEKCSYCEQ